MSESPVPVGSMLFTLVDPHRGQEVAYNRWYERDHFYAGCMIGPWLFAGRRFVATRALKECRFPADSPVAGPLAGSYLAVYWVQEGHHEDHFQWANDQVHDLYENDRGFADRTHVHTILANHAGTVYRDADPVPIELSLDHPYAGLVCVFIDRADGVDHETLTRELDAGPLRKLLDGSPVACAAGWLPISREGDVTQNSPMDLGSDPGGPERSIQLCFLETDPREVWPRFVEYGEAVDASGLGRVGLAAPLIPTVVGTDRYTDELW